MNEFYKFKMEADTEEPSSAELLIFAQIGEWEDMGDIGARGFAKSLGELPKSVKRIDLHINSPGGSVFEASAIYSRLADHPSKKVVYIDGLAASAASIIAMVGHKIYMRENAQMMIHLPSGIAMGNSDDMRHMATALDSITESMINVYAKRTKQERDQLRSWMAEESWFTAQRAVDNGFADEVRGVVKAAAVVGDKRVIINGCEFDLSRFSNVPAFAATTTKGQTMATKKKDEAAEQPPKAEETPKEEAPKEEAPAKEQPKEPLTTEEATIPKKPAKDFDQGVTAERARVAALQKLDRPATHDIVVKAIAEGKEPSDIIAECMEAMDKAAKGRDRKHDARSMERIPPAEGSDDEEDFGALLTKKVQGVLKTRGHRSALHSRN